MDLWQRSATAWRVEPKTNAAGFRLVLVDDRGIQVGQPLSDWIDDEVVARIMGASTSFPEYLEAAA